METLDEASKKLVFPILKRFNSEVTEKISNLPEGNSYIETKVDAHIFWENSVYKKHCIRNSTFPKKIKQIQLVLS